MAGGAVDLATAGGLFEARTISQMVRPIKTGMARMTSTMIQCQMLKLPMCFSSVLYSIDQRTQHPNQAASRCGVSLDELLGGEAAELLLRLLQLLIGHGTGFLLSDDAVLQSEH
jgi:hypothetical protein